MIGYGCLVHLVGLAGLFGMNLLSGYENHPHAFYQVTLAMTMAMVGMFGAAMWYGVRAKLV